MSRVGIRPVEVPEGVEFEIKPTTVKVSANNNHQEVAIPHGIKIKHKDSKVTVERANDSKILRSFHGTVRALLANAVKGVSSGFEKRLELVGIGYRANVEGNQLNLQVGYTHPVKVVIPEGLTAKVEKNVIIVNGFDKQQLGQFCAEVRSIRKPEPYKGKGIRYQGERIRMKQGKAAKSGA